MNPDFRYTIELEENGNRSFHGTNDPFSCYRAYNMLRSMSSPKPDDERTEPVIREYGSIVTIMDVIDIIPSNKQK